MEYEERDRWELSDLEIKTCDNCKWENEYLEEEPGGGGAPCLRCTRYEGE